MGITATEVLVLLDNEEIIPFVLNVFVYSCSNNDSDDGVVPTHEEHQYKTLTNAKQ